MLSFILTHFTPFLVILLQQYSQFVFYIRQQKYIKGIGNILYEIIYLLDAFVKGKMIEPYQWNICVGYFTNDYNYNEVYDSQIKTRSWKEDTEVLFIQKVEQNQNQKMICKQTTVSDHELEEAGNSVPPFCSVQYTCYNELIEMDIPREYFIEGNEILSNLFVARYLKHHHPSKIFDKTYQINIIDFELNCLQVNWNSYVLLEEDGPIVVCNEKKT